MVGRNAVIGGNAFITSSVPEGAKVSIGNQELRYNFDSKQKNESEELKQDDSWYYII